MYYGPGSALSFDYNRAVFVYVFQWEKATLGCWEELLLIGRVGGQMLWASGRRQAIPSYI